MNMFMKKASKKSGAKPGSIIYVGEQHTEDAVIDIIDYNETEYNQQRVDKVEQCFPFKTTPTISWINISGIHRVDIIEKVGAHFGMHPLVLEDIANTGHRPKIEEFEDYTFVILKMLYQDEQTGRIIAEQVSLLLGDTWVITFQETGEDVFEGVRDRIRKTTPRVRLMSPDYLAYSLIDAVVDNYYIVLENLGERLEGLEDELVTDPTSENLDTIHELKRELIFMRKSVWPLREVVGALERTESKLIKKITRPYLRDLYEHTIQVIDSVETFRDMVSGLLDIYMSSISNRMNEVMKVLTIIATIFIPLGFLAGVYGMNFDTSTSPTNMPELSFKYGYIMFWVTVLAVGGGLFAFFKRKKWI